MGVNEAYRRIKGLSQEYFDDDVSYISRHKQEAVDEAIRILEEECPEVKEEE